MSISSAMYTGLTGISSNGEAMGVVGDNIANLNTTGFKYSQVNFEDLMAQMVSTGSGPGQVGRGGRISQITPIFSQGSLETSADDVDVAITGTGFLIVKEPTGAAVYYTRDGNFSLNKDGYLVNAHGYRVQGKAMDATTGTASGVDTDIIIQQNFSNPKATSDLEMVLNLNSATTNGENYTSALSVYDTTGNAHSLNMTYTKMNDQMQSTVNCGDPTGLGGTYWTISGINTSGTTIDYYVWYNSGSSTDPAPTGRTGIEVDISAATSAADVAAATATALSALSGIFTASSDPDGQLTVIALNGTPTWAVDGTTTWGSGSFAHEGQHLWRPSATLDGTSVTITDAGGTTLSDMIFNESGRFIESSTGSYDIDLSAFNIGNPVTNLTTLDLKDTSGGATTQYAAASVTNYASQDGYPPGFLQRISINNEGVITGNFSNGQITPLYQLTLARFNAPTKLHREGSNMYTETQDSGVPLTGAPSTNGLGSITSNSLEQSNVDLGEQFVHMILYQRAFQANSRVITTSDALLEEVLSLKR
jgi:flagellar hook protein FlgE